MILIGLVYDVVDTQLFYDLYTEVMFLGCSCFIFYQLDRPSSSSTRTYLHGKVARF